MPTRALLSDFGRDAFALASTIVTLVGFIIAYWQIRKTKSAALAAKDAADRSFGESRRHFQKYVLSNILRSLAEAKILVAAQARDKAAMRLNDLGDQISQLADTDEGWQILLSEVRYWETVFRGNRRIATKKWDDLVDRLQAKIDSVHGPFKGI